MYPYSRQILLFYALLVAYIPRCVTYPARGPSVEVPERGDLTGGDLLYHSSTWINGIYQMDCMKCRLYRMGLQIVAFC